MGKKYKKYSVVGEVTEEMAELVDFNYTGKVYMAPGFRKHIKKHKKDLEDEILENLTEYISDIIKTPEYIGSHPKKRGTSIELIKEYNRHLLVAIEVDLNKDYIYVASLYPITKGKLNNRLHSGRFKEYKALTLNDV